MLCAIDVRSAMVPHTCINRPRVSCNIILDNNIDTCGQQRLHKVTYCMPPKQMAPILELHMGSVMGGDNVDDLHDIAGEHQFTFVSTVYQPYASSIPPTSATQTSESQQTLALPVTCADRGGNSAEIAQTEGSAIPPSPSGRSKSCAFSSLERGNAPITSKLDHKETMLDVGGVSSQTPRRSEPSPGQGASRSASPIVPSLTQEHTASDQHHSSGTTTDSPLPSLKVSVHFESYEGSDRMSDYFLGSIAVGDVTITSKVLIKVCNGDNPAAVQLALREDTAFMRLQHLQGTVVPRYHGLWQAYNVYKTCIGDYHSKFYISVQEALQYVIAPGWNRVNAMTIAAVAQSIHAIQSAGVAYDASKITHTARRHPDDLVICLHSFEDSVLQGEDDFPAAVIRGQRLVQRLQDLTRSAS